MRESLHLTIYCIYFGLSTLIIGCAKTHISLENQSSKTLAQTENTKSDSQSQTKSKFEEVYVNEGVVFILKENDANIALYGESYALLPRSKALKAFLNQQQSMFDMRTLRSNKSMTQIYNQGKNILFYYSSNKGSNLYNRIAPKRFKLTLEELSDESKEPNEIIQVYRIHNFNEAILNAPCIIVQSNQFIRDRARSEMLINLDTHINAKLLTQEQTQLFLECSIEENKDISNQISQI
ncbi:hypothetical protein OQH61_07755 [Helicobacter sp. MIT 21-1697]|uniref:hypothetical protein n=1 Tax=Helicobacter sp. MIT 21-1697 TaxID=2993733 RepID=UPI00224B31FA|nr:hypothetical protein [Helicobacter sp. MIT 21-1697]MCX2717626.1 hypothetical protein [Helicobacter sp. MIT 21-1697]